jgi:hypothetical protein
MYIHSYLGNKSLIKPLTKAMHFKTVKQVLTIQRKEIDHILKMGMYIYLNQYTCSCKNSSYDFPSAGILHNSIDFVTPSMWLEADSADVCRLNVKHSKISVLMKPATTLIGTLLKIQF